jgi:sialate O-acetylesterase
MSQELDVWVLAGQSNMEGVGALSEALPPDPRVWSFTSAGAWEVAQEPLHRFWESFTPVHQLLRRPGLPAEMQGLSDAELAAQERAERAYGTGLGLAFGIAMADATGRKIGLVPAAHGGTSLAQWTPVADDTTGESLYGAMLLRIARAGGTLRGVLWYQGESECWSADYAASYAERFAAWVARLRTDVGQPDLPVLTVQLGRSTINSIIPAAWDVVRQVQYEMPAHVPHLTVTSAVDLPLVDAIHINAGGLVRLGRRMARQALGQPSPRVARAVLEPARPGMGAVRLWCTGVTGGWQPADDLAGFAITDADGQPVPDNYVFNAHPDRDDPTQIVLHLNLPARPGDRVAYAQGIFPYANVVDAADMPLCSVVVPVETA